MNGPPRTSTPVRAACVPLLLALGTTTLLAQDPQPAPPRKLADKEARALLKEIGKDLKDSKARLKTRLDTVEKLTNVSHRLLVKPLVKIVKTDKAKTVRQAAIKALGRQPKRRARPELMNFLKKANIHKEPSFAAALIRAVGDGSYVQNDWRELQKMFEKTLDVPAATDTHIAIMEVAGRHRECEAVEYLLGHIDEPAPAFVDDPSNPPASYWEARFKNWRKWRPHLIESLYKITGQRFGSSKEARTWWKANGAKLTASIKREKSTRGKKSRKKSER